MSIGLLGIRLRELRKSKKLSQGQIAEYAGISQSTLSDIENGKIAPKTLDAVVSLSTYYQCSADYLLGLTDNPFPIDRDILASDGEIARLLRLVLRMSDEARYALLTVAEALVNVDDPKPSDILRDMDSHA